MSPDNWIDTIAAIATPPGKGGVGVIRVCGPLVQEIAKKMIGEVPIPRQALFRALTNAQGDIIDKGLVIYFQGPHSFTGNDVLEIQGHGGPVIMDMLLEHLITLGVRIAKPGEFSHRAYLNGKIDLAQAEAIADLINASTQKAAMGAMRSLQGVFSQEINTLSNFLKQLRIQVEANIDFPDEDITTESEKRLLEKLNEIETLLKSLLAQTKQGQLLKEGMHIAIVGQPNAGKSSLLNILAGKDAAIVTPIPGTTRDCVKESIQIDGLPLHIVDTAGIRHDVELIEEEGIRRSFEQQKMADQILLLIDATQNPLLGDIENKILNDYPNKVTVVVNKTDLITLSPSKDKIYISAKTGYGLNQLKDHLKSIVNFQDDNNSLFVARRRHVLALEKALHHCHLAKVQANNQGFALMAEELRYAQDHLGEIVGKTTSDELLGEIFSTFCIGK